MGVEEMKKKSSEIEEEFHEKLEEGKSYAKKLPRYEEEVIEEMKKKESKVKKELDLSSLSKEVEEGKSYMKRMAPSKKELVKEIEGEVSVPFLSEKLEEGKTYVKHLVNEAKKLLKASTVTKASSVEEEMDVKEAEGQQKIELKTSLRKA